MAPPIQAAPCALRLFRQQEVARRRLRCGIGAQQWAIRFVLELHAREFASERLAQQVPELVASLGIAQAFATDIEMQLRAASVWPTRGA